jgi:hypothetical protein
MENSADEIDFSEYLRLLVKNRIIILLCFFAGILFALGIVFFYPQKYQAETVIKLGQIEKSPGEFIYIENAEQMASETKWFFSRENPFLEINPISDGIISIKNYSTDKNESKKGILDIVLKMTMKSEDIKNGINSEIKQLKDMKDKLNLQGQQATDISLRIFDLQKKLNSFLPTDVIQQPTVTPLKKGLGTVLNLIVGAVLGVFVGIVIVFLREWWMENKKYIL